MAWRVTRAALGATTCAAAGGAWPGPGCGPRLHGGGAAAAATLWPGGETRLLAPGGAPAELARRLGRTIPLVYGSAGVAAVAAQWWKAQVNLNAKAPAFAATLPELTHDELAGLGPGRRRDAPDDVAGAPAPRRRGAADGVASSTRCGRPPTR